MKSSVCEPISGCANETKRKHAMLAMPFCGVFSPLTIAMPAAGFGHEDPQVAFCRMHRRHGWYRNTLYNRVGKNCLVDPCCVWTVWTYFEREIVNACHNLSGTWCWQDATQTLWSSPKSWTSLSSNCHPFLPLTCSGNFDDSLGRMHGILIRIQLLLLQRHWSHAFCKSKLDIRIRTFAAIVLGWASFRKFASP